MKYLLRFLLFLFGLALLAFALLYVWASGQAPILSMEAFELRTVLLIGEFGNHPDDELVEVSIIGDLLARSGQNYKEQKVSVTPLEKGPSLSYAEYFT